MKVCVICFGFRKANLSLQPWVYIHELCKGIIQNNMELRVVTDIDRRPLQNEAIEDTDVRYVKRLSSPFGWSKEVVKVLEEEGADVVIALLGWTNFVRLNLSTGKPSIGIVTSPLYSLGEMMRLGVWEMTRHFRDLLIHFAGAVIPHCLIRRGMSYFDHVVVMSQANKKQLEGWGIASEMITVVPPGIHESDLDLPEQREIQELKSRAEAVPVVLYFGSPTTLRGPDKLIEAFAKVVRKVPAKLIVLSRIERTGLVEEENILIKMAKSSRLTEIVEIISGYLDGKELKKYISTADVVCLPFKLAISDVPMSILEAMAAGKPVVSTNVDGIAELLDGRGIVVRPCDSNALAESIIALLTNPDSRRELGRTARDYMIEYPRWNHVREVLTKLISDVSEKKEIKQRHC